MLPMLDRCQEILLQSAEMLENCGLLNEKTLNDYLLLFCETPQKVGNYSNVKEREMCTLIDYSNN